MVDVDAEIFSVPEPKINCKYCKEIKKAHGVRDQHDDSLIPVCKECWLEMIG